MDTISYFNRGKTRTARVSIHAREQFRRRWLRYRTYLGGKANGHASELFRDEYLADMLASQVDGVLADLLRRMRKVRREEYDAALRKRDRRHGGHPVRFRLDPFEVVIVNSVLVTIEIRGTQDVRRLNRSARIDEPRPAATPTCWRNAS